MELGDSVAQLVALLGSAVASTLLTAAGLLAERAGLQHLLAGQAGLGLWEAGMGALALFVGVYLLGYRNVWRRVSA